MTRQSWQSFTSVRSESFVRGLVEGARDVAPDELVEFPNYRSEERKGSCKGVDPLRAFVAYAQDELAYDASDKLIPVKDRTAYSALPRERRFNKFGLAYRPDSKFWLNRILADIVSGAAVRLYQTQGWKTVLYDGLRTVDGAFNLYHFATDEDIASGLLALPGQSAHNKGLAVDSMMEDDEGREIDMGGHFDHLDMTTNSRTYAGEKLSEMARKNRLTREAAFLYSALTQGLLVAPLRSEFWDDRLPENREDLWRVLDSAARCLDIPLLTEEDIRLRKADREAFRQKWESWSYADFLTRWEETFRGRRLEMYDAFGVMHPLEQEKPEFYHGNFHPIYDDMLRPSGKHLTEARVAA